MIPFSYEKISDLFKQCPYKAIRLQFNGFIGFIFPCDEVRVITVHINTAVFFTEIEQCKQFLITVFSIDTQNIFGTCCSWTEFRTCLEYIIVGTNRFQFPQSLEYLSLIGLTAVKFLVYIRMIHIVIELTDFITAVNNGYTALCEHIGMEHDIRIDGKFQGFIIVIP